MAPKNQRAFLGRWTRGRSQSRPDGESGGEEFDVTEAFITDLPGGRVPPLKPQKRAIKIVAGLAAAVLVLLFLLNLQNVILRMKGIPPGLWSKNGELVIGQGTPFLIKGFSWYGMEEEMHILGGLVHTSVDSVLKFATTNNFNTLRIPLAFDNFKKNPIIQDSIDTIKNFRYQNPDGLTHREFLRRFVKHCAEKNKLVLFDLHRLEAANRKLTGLWYGPKVSEDDVVHFWESVCQQHYRDWNVVGADLTNEPYKAIWDNSKSVNNWKRASKRIASALHKRCPHWLIVIEGMGNIAQKYEDDPFWGEALTPMATSPLEIDFPRKISLSAHVYGPSVYEQKYFKASNFPENMPAIWNKHFGNVHNATKFATIIGEWGGKYEGRDKMWQDRFAKYLAEKKFSFFYWCLNPTSGDTNGLLKNDWESPEHGKLAMLNDFRGTPVKPLKSHLRRRMV